MISNPVMKTRVTTKVMSSRLATVNVAAWKTVRAVVKMMMVLAVIVVIGTTKRRIVVPERRSASPEDHLITRERLNPAQKSTPTPILTPTPAQPIPEPATLLLFGSGLLALGAEKKRRHARRNRASVSAETEGGRTC